MTNDKTKILVLTPWKRRWELGQAAGLSDDYYFIKKFVDTGFELHYVGPKDDDPVDVPFDNYFVHSFPNFFDATANWPTPVRRLLWPVLFTVFGTFRAYRVALRIKPSFILGQTHVTSLPVYILRKLLGVPSGVKLFGVMDLVRSDWSRWKYLYKNFEHVLAFKIPQDVWIVLDDGTGGEAAALRHGVSADRVRSLPNGINLEWQERVANPRPLLDGYQIPNDSAVVLYLARMVDWKRPDALIRAIPYISRESSRSVVFLVAGDGPLRERCVELARELDVDSRVRFAGPVPHEKVPDMMAGSTVFASTNQRTNMGIPTCEALVCGLPVVAFDVGNTSTVVKNDVTGKLVADGDIEGLARAIVELIEDDEARQRLANRARAFARENFTDWDARTNMELEIITTMIEGRDVADRAA